MDSLPTIYSAELHKSQLFVQAPLTNRKQLTQRIFQECEMQIFCDQDIISTFDDLNEKHSPL